MKALICLSWYFSIFQSPSIALTHYDLGASVFFANMLAVGGIGSFGLELSLLPTYGMKLVMSVFQTEALQTQRMLDDAKTPPSIDWGNQIPPVVFSFLVMVIYLPIVPIMELLAFIYFGGMYIVMKHQCLHVYAQPFEGGGVTTWQNLFGFLMACMYIAEFINIAYMGLKEAPVQALCGFGPFGMTVIVHMMIRRNIIQYVENLSLEVAADIDLRDGELNSPSTFPPSIEEELYGQPALRMAADEREPMPYRRRKSESIEAA
jgi:hypothetical protein